MIPKIIHYCWLSNDPIPQDLQNYMKTWKEKLSDYEFILWNFDRFDINSSLWVKQAFESKKYAFAADFIRLFAVYNYGGIYMDMDIEVLRSFNDLLEAPLMVAYENNEENGIEAGCFGAEKGNPLIGECLEYYNNRCFIKNDNTFDVVPLPKILIQYINEKKNINIYSADYFTCKSYQTGIITTTNNSYAIHNFAGSWCTDYDKYVSNVTYKIYARYGKNVFSRFLVIIFRIYSKIKKFGFIKTLKYYINGNKLQ